MPLTDTHCHLNFDQFEKDRWKVIDRAWDAGLERLLVPAVDRISSHKVIDLAESTSGIYATVGVHPNSANTWDRNTLNDLGKLSSHYKVVAIGEIGLDYYRNRASHNTQKRIFRDQLNLAADLDLPVVIHIRNANEVDRKCFFDVLEILTKWRVDIEDNIQQSDQLIHPGVLHSFSGNEREGRQAIEMGFLIGITGTITFKNAHNLRKVLHTIPLSNLLIETDAPFLSPQPHRGKRNEPAYVRYVAEKIGGVLSKPFDKVAETTTNNADRLFQWREFD